MELPSGPDVLAEGKLGCPHLHTCVHTHISLAWPVIAPLRVVKIVKCAPRMVQAHSMWVLGGPGGVLDNAAEKQQPRAQRWGAVPGLRHPMYFLLACRTHSSQFNEQAERARGTVLVLTVTVPPEDGREQAAAP